MSGKANGKTVDEIKKFSTEERTYTIRIFNNNNKFGYDVMGFGQLFDIGFESQEDAYDAAIAAVRDRESKVF